MKKITLTCAHAIVKYLIAQKILINAKKDPLFPGVFGIFGHGNVACLGQALEENQQELSDYRTFCNRGTEATTLVPICAVTLRGGYTDRYLVDS